MPIALSGLSPRRAARPVAVWQHLPSLAASLVPGVAFAAGLFWLRRDARFAWIALPARWPWELWIIATAGVIATAAGVGDWVYHRTSGCVVGPKERKAELLALACGGVPLFVLMALATLSAHPAVYLLPILAVLVLTVVLICYDELVFHRRRCLPLETALHRALVFGHAVAFGAWVHFCFVRGVFHA